MVEEGAFLIDVRRNDVVDVPLEGAVQVSPDEIPQRLDELPRDRPIILACT